jgi:hypothetical protein
MAGSTTVVDQNRRRPAQFLHAYGTFVMGIFMMALAAGLGGLLLYLWPASSMEAGKVVWTGLNETIALAIVMISGALGSFIHIANSFTSFVGNRRLSASWVWWFLLRAPMGSALALVVYFILRSGFLLDGGLGTQLSPFGIAAIGAVVGIASKQIIDKLRNVADTTFNTNEDDMRVDKL